MTDREKVIKGFECCHVMVHDLGPDKTSCGICPYKNVQTEEQINLGVIECIAVLHDDALAMLKEQEHSERFTVIDSKTGEEADTYDIALHEDWAKQLCYCDMEGWAIEEDGTLLLVDECGRFEYADRERFKVKWE